ncbi:hypothetical protein D3C84_948000 [compost metagenome]
MTALDQRSGHQRESVTQVLPARIGLQLLLRAGVLNPFEQLFVTGDIQAGAQPAGQHRGLVEAPLAQTFSGERNGDQRIWPFQPFIEAMLQVLSKKFGEQATIRPLRAVLESGDQAVDRKTVGPRGNDLLEGRRLLQALAARQARCG